MLQQRRLEEEQRQKAADAAAKAQKSQKGAKRKQDSDAEKIKSKKKKIMKKEKDEKKEKEEKKEKAKREKKKKEEKAKKEKEQGKRAESEESIDDGDPDEKLPVWKKPNEPEPLVGALPPEPGYVIPSGNLAVVRDKTKEPTWILAKIVSSNKDKYNVEDQDDKKKFQVPKKNVRPLPLYMPPYQGMPNAFYKKGARVLALYPRTTCFYPANVHQQPGRGRSNYTLRFDDDDDENGKPKDVKVAVRFVVELSS